MHKKERGSVDASEREVTLSMQERERRETANV